MRSRKDFERAIQIDDEEIDAHYNSVALRSNRSGSHAHHKF